MHFLSLNTNPDLRIKQNQRLILSYAMQKAFHVLKLPTLELAEWLKVEIEQNHVLEYEGAVDEGEEVPTDLSEGKEMDFERSQFEVIDDLDENFQNAAFSESKQWSQLQTEKAQTNYQESLLTYKTSLFEHLMHQAKQSFSNPEDLLIAEHIIGNLDERGFLSVSLDKLAAPYEISQLKPILKEIQTFDPPGIGAQSLRESLLIQLKIKGKEKSLAYAVIDKHFDELLNNRMPVLQKKTKSSTQKLQEAIKNEIQRLNVHPGYSFLSEPPQPIIPDIYVRKEDEVWHVEVNTDPFPTFRISTLYNKTLLDPNISLAEKDFLRRHIASGKWLERIINRRNKTLKEITTYLIQKQEAFLNGDAKALVPLTMQEVAQKLQVHESTIARAVANKYIAFSHGVFSMRSFFTHALIDNEGQQISNSTIKQLLTKLIEDEDKARPLSDQALSSKISNKGVPCARRTVAKYRHSLKIAPASHRRRWGQT